MKKTSLISMLLILVALCLPLAHLVFAQQEQRKQGESQLDYGKFLEPQFVSDAPWRIEPGNSIQFLFMIARTNSIVRLDSIRIYDDNNSGTLVWGNHFNGELIGYSPSEQYYWIYAVNLSTDSFNHPLGMIHARCQFVKDHLGVGETNPRPKHLMIKIANEALPNFDGDTWYYGDTHLHSIYSRSGLNSSPFFDVEFGAPLFAIHDATKAIGLDWVTITDHSCYLDENSFYWKYQIAGQDSQIMGDPSLTRWQNLAEDILINNNAHPDFPFILGEEITVEGNSSVQVPPYGENLHFLSYDDDYITAGNNGLYLPPPFTTQFPASITLGIALQEVESLGGYSYAAHPKNSFRIPILWNPFSWWMIYPWMQADYEESLPFACFRGLELWNTHITAQASPDVNNPFSYWASYPIYPYSELNSGLLDWDILLSDGLDFNPISGEVPPRQIFIEAGSDAHGDFNYMTTTNQSGNAIAVNNAIGKVRTMVYCPNGLAPDSIKEALKEGHSILTNGPIVKFGIDVNGDNDLDDSVDLAIGDAGIVYTNQLVNAHVIVDWTTTNEFNGCNAFSICLYEGRPSTQQHPIPHVVASPQSLTGNISLSLNDLITSTPIYLRVVGVSCPPGGDEYRCYTNPIWIKVEEPAINYAVQYNGSSGYGSVPNNSTLNFGSGDFTVEAIIHLNSLPGNYDPDVLCKDELASTNHHIVLHINCSNGRPGFFALGSGGEYIVNALTQISTTPNSVYHLAGVREGNSLKIYVNGILEGTNPNAPLGNTNSDGPLGIADWITNNGTHRYFPGVIDEVRLWNDARTQPELDQYKFQELVGNEPNLVAYYRFNENTGNNFEDLSPNSNNGTLSGGYQWVQFTWPGLDEFGSEKSGSNYPATFVFHASPNPFNPATTLSYTLPAAARVKLSIFDIQGRLVATLVDGYREAGVQEVIWDAAGLPSGIYGARLNAVPLSGETGSRSAVQKLVLLK